MDLENKIVAEVMQLVKDKLNGEGTGHDWFHIERVYNNALQIQRQEGGNLFIVELAALLHDISDHKFNGGDFEKGGEVAKEILSRYGVTEDIQEAVADIINKVSFKGSDVKDEMSILEGMIVQDADRIDALGAIGIARAFAYGGAKQREIYNPDIPPQKHKTKEEYARGESHTINHFYEKLLLLEERMHTSYGKKLARERTIFMKQFLEQFYEEWKGTR